MDKIRFGTTDYSVLFALAQAGLTVANFKITYTRWLTSDGTSFTKSTATTLTALASITTAHTNNYGIYMSATVDDGGKFLFRADFPDAAFAAGAHRVICSLYDDGDNEVAQRIFDLTADLSEYQGAIWYDAAAAGTGTQLGVHGLPRNPVNSITNAITLANSLGTKRIMVKGNAALSISTVDFTFESWDGTGQITGSGSADISNAKLYDLTVIGSFTMDEDTRMYRCAVGTGGSSISGLNGSCYGCTFGDSTALANGAYVRIFDGQSHEISGSSGNCEISLGGYDSTLNVYSWHGYLSIQGFTNAGAWADINMRGGRLTITGTDGDYRLFGEASLVDSTSGSCSVVNYMISADVTAIKTRVETGVPNAAPGGNNGVPTVDVNNYIAGIQGMKNDFDDLNDISAAAVNAEIDQALLDYDSSNGVAKESSVLAIKAVTDNNHGGVIDCNLLEINDNSVVGNLATLTLKHLNIVNADGHAVDISASGSGHDGVNITSADARAVDLLGKTFGLNVESNAVSGGQALRIYGGSGSNSIGIVATGTLYSAYFTSDATAIRIAGLGTGHGIHVTGGDGGATGDGILSESLATNGNGFKMIGKGSGKDIDADEITNILADTNELQTDWTNGGRLDLILDDILQDTGTTLPASLSAIDGKIDTIDTNVDSIESLLITVNGKVDTVDTNVDTLLSRLTATRAGYLDELDFDLQSNISAIKTKTDNLPSRLKKNTAYSNFHFVMIDSADHISPESGLTVTATRSIDNGAFGACANSPVDVGNGLYRIDLDASDLNGDTITFRFTAPGADARLLTVVTNL